MKKIIYTVIFLTILSCNQKDKNFLQGKLWISEYKTNPELLLFDKNECIRLTTDFENLYKISIDTLSWIHENDSLKLTSSNYTSKFKLITFKNDSLILQVTDNSYTNSITYYAIERNEHEYNTDLVRDFFANNSFIAKSSISEKEYKYDFITKNKCINQFDNINFQLEHWKIQKFNNEIFFIFQSPVFSAFLHLKNLTDTNVEFEYYYHGKNNLSFEQINNKAINSIKDLLINKWFHKVVDTMPLPPLPPNQEKTETVEGILWEFKNDNSYVYKEKRKVKKGNWNLVFNNRYVLLDNFNSQKSVLKINNIDSSKIVLKYKDKTGETRIDEFKRIEK